MSDQFTWYKDEATWHRYKELCEDKDQFGPSYSEWAATVQRKINGLASQGVNLVKVSTDAEKFSAWCQQNSYPLNAKYRSLYLAECYTGDKLKH